MNIITERLVHHQYNCEEIVNGASSNCLKDTIDGIVFDINYPYNTKHMFSEDISKHDLAIEIKDESDSYMFFFVNIQIATEGNKRYVINKIIIDEGLSETCVREFSHHAITTFVNGDITTKDYIFTDKQYAFYSHTLKDIMPSVLDSIIQSYMITKKRWYETQRGIELINRVTDNN